MSSILKQVRLDLGKTLSQVSSDLKIRKKYLIALEEGNFDVLPGEVYIKGYMKLYLDYLNIKERNTVQIEENKKSENEKLLKINKRKALMNYRYKKRLVLISIVILFIFIIIHPFIESA